MSYNYRMTPIIIATTAQSESSRLVDILTRSGFGCEIIDSVTVEVFRVGKIPERLGIDGVAQRAQKLLRSLISYPNEIVTDSVEFYDEFGNSRTVKF